MQHRWFRVFLHACVLWSCALLSPGARSNSPSLSWISKSIRRCHPEDSTAEGARRCETTPWVEGVKTLQRGLWCVSPPSQQLFRGFRTHTHTHGPVVPPPLTTSWPHSSHLLLRPWLTCPPNRKISRLFTNGSLKLPQVIVLLGQKHNFMFWHHCNKKGL